MLRGVEQHPLQMEAVGGLDFGPLGDRHPSPAQTVGQFIANLLELAEIQEPRIGTALAHTGLEPAHWKGGQEGIRQLVLKPGDLASQCPPGSQFGSRRVRLTDRGAKLVLPDVLV